MAATPAADNLKKARPTALPTWPSTRKVGLHTLDMVKSRWVYRKLRNFRAGIEADISCLKRAYGLGRCTWRASPTSRPTSGPRSSPTSALFTRLRPA